MFISEGIGIAKIKLANAKDGIGEEGVGFV